MTTEPPSSKPQKQLEKWSEFGVLQSPFVTLGLEKDFYKQKKKSELYTDTKKYLNKRNKYIESIGDKVNDEWINTMKEMKDVAFGERKALADKIAKKVAFDHLKIADELYPNANQALEQAANISKVTDIVEGNLSVKPPRKPRAPKAQEALETSKALLTGKPRGRPRKKKDETK